jgi:hypothetical protein
MPLDQIARRYADEMYTTRMEDILRAQQAKVAESRANHARRGLPMSGIAVSNEAKIRAETAGLLAEARVETLLKAYERAGVPFDESVLQEITAEVEQFCNTKKKHAADAVAQSANQTWGGNCPPNLIASVKSQVENAVNSTFAKIARELRIRRYEVALDERKTAKVYGAALGKQWDVFISHASEDKDDFARPLADALTQSGLSVWYDETSLKVGDNLRREIDHGLANSRFGIVILSHNFFAKQWAQQELEGLFSREVEGVKVILPVWHKITASEVRVYSPMLAGKFAANSSAGLEVVVRQLREAMGLRLKTTLARRDGSVRRVATLPPGFGEGWGIKAAGLHTVVSPERERNRIL